MSARSAAVVAPSTPAPMVATAIEASAPILNWLFSRACSPFSVSTMKMTSAVLDADLQAEAAAAHAVEGRAVQPVPRPPRPTSTQPPP